MPKASQSRPGSPPDQTFPQWIKEFGVEKLATKCGVTERTVYNWMSRDSRPSKITAVQTIMGLAPHLCLSEILGLAGGRK